MTQSRGVDQPLGPRETLALIDEQRERAERSYTVSQVPFFTCWGVTYLVAGGAFYLAHARGPALFPLPVAFVVLGTLVVASIVFSAIYGARSGQGLRGQSQVTGAMYGVSWPIAFTGLTAVNVTVSERFGLAEDAVVTLWTGTALVLIGALYMVGGALWRDTAMYVMGLVMLAGAALSVLAGVPVNYLVLSVVVGGGLLVLAGYYAWRPARAGESE